jgi:uncharacterized protein YbjT (DUF2867 family)
MPTTHKLNVLVYGATGVQAGPVVGHLLQRGHQPYILTRNPAKAAALQAVGAQVIVGDLADADLLDQANNGMDAVALLIPFFSNPADAVIYGRNAIDAAHKAGVSLIVWNPTGTIPSEATGNPSVDVRIEIADYLRNSGVKHIILQPTAYTENLLGPYTAPFVAQHDKLMFPTPPDMRVGWISAEDMGALVAAALERPELANANFMVSGIVNPNGPELAAEFSAALGRPINYEAMAPAQFGAILDQLFGPGTGAAAAKVYQAMWDTPDFRPMMHVDMQPVLELLPVRMGSLQEWVAKHAAAFTSVPETAALVS